MERVKQLYELYNETIFRYFARMTGNMEEAGELTQETFYQACLSIHRFRQESSPKTWLFSIGRNVYLKHLRNKTRQRTYGWGETLYVADQVPPEVNNPGELVLIKETKERIQKALALLPENARTILILKEYEELSYEEIAQIFGQTLNWARVTFFRAKQQLGQVYKDLEGDDT
jgi:RNA polymerase sigma-70 factor (ECF subfamily)